MKLLNIFPKKKDSDRKLALNSISCEMCVTDLNFSSKIVRNFLL